MQHGMPQSLIVFVVSSTLGTPNFGTFGGIAHTPPPFENSSELLSSEEHFLHHVTKVLMEPIA